MVSPHELQALFPGGVELLVVLVGGPVVRGPLRALRGDGADGELERRVEELERENR